MTTNTKRIFTKAAALLIASTAIATAAKPVRIFILGGNMQTIHWHGNGESYWLVGEAMGRDMVKLLEKGN